MRLLPPSLFARFMIWLHCLFAHWSLEWNLLWWNLCPLFPYMVIGVVARLVARRAHRRRCHLLPYLEVSEVWRVGRGLERRMSEWESILSVTFFMHLSAEYWSKRHGILLGLRHIPASSLVVWVLNLANHVLILKWLNDKIIQKYHAENVSI